jgi:hypothetical protein
LHFVRSISYGSNRHIGKSSILLSEELTTQSISRADCYTVDTLIAPSSVPSIGSIPAIPSYVSQYPASRVSSVCSCFLGQTNVAQTVSATATAIFDPYRPSCGSFSLVIRHIDTVIFNTLVLADQRDIITPSAGVYHQCNGLNGGSNAQSGVTPITLIDAAAKFAGFTYDGTWSDGSQDYTLTTIDGFFATGIGKWEFSVNGQPYSNTGGCKTLLVPGDSVQWIYNDGNIEIQGPPSVLLGSDFVVSVLGGAGAFPLAGATITVSGLASPSVQTSNALGKASFTATGLGTLTVTVISVDYNPATININVL